MRSDGVYYPPVKRRRIHWTLHESRDIRVMLWRINFGRPRLIEGFYGGPHSVFTFGPLWIDRYA